MNKDKVLLLKDLSSRLPYSPIVHIIDQDGTEVDALLTTSTIDNLGKWVVKPYLRPMSSMTKEERNYIQECIDIVSDENYEDGYSPSAWSSMTDFTDYCNSRHLDYRNLIGEGLALEAPSDMYKEE